MSIPRWLIGAAVQGLLVGVALGALAADKRAKRWPASQGLDADDRCEVVDAVLRGESPVDGRLAPAAVELAHVFQQPAKQRQRWIPAERAEATARAALATLDPTTSGSAVRPPARGQR